MLGIGLERGNDVHPVQCVQVIEMHHVVLHHLGEEHHVADDLGIRWNLDVQSVFNRAHRSQRMNRSTNTADAFTERPGIARVAALEDHLQATPHGAGRHGLADVVAFVQRGFDAQVTFDTGHGINNDSSRHMELLLALCGCRRYVVRVNCFGVLANDGGDQMSANA